MDQKSEQENMAIEERWPLWGGGRYSTVFMVTKIGQTSAPMTQQANKYDAHEV